MLKKGKQSEVMQGNDGCLAGHVCKSVRILVFAPHLCSIPIPGLGEYTDGCRILRGADWHPFCLGWGTGWWSGELGGPSGGSSPKSVHAFRKRFPACCLPEHFLKEC